MIGSVRFRRATAHTLRVVTPREGAGFGALGTEGAWRRAPFGLSEAVTHDDTPVRCELLNAFGSRQLLPETTG